MDVDDIPVIGSGQNAAPPAGTSGPGRMGLIVGVVALAGLVAVLTTVADLPSLIVEQSPPSTVLSVPTDPPGATLDRMEREGPWTPTVLPGGGIGLDIAFSGEKWLATTVTFGRSSSQLWASADGVVWTPVFDQELVLAGIGSLLPLADGTWMAGGVSQAFSSESVPGIWTSPNGLDWVEASAPAAPGMAVARLEEGEGVLVALVVNEREILGRIEEMPGEEVWTSRDRGQSWQRLDLAGIPEEIAAVGGEVLIGGVEAGEATIWRSSMDFEGTTLPAAGKVDAVAAIPGGGALVRTLATGDVGWFRSDDLSDWEDLGDGAFGVRSHNLVTAGLVVVALPGDRSSNQAVYATEDGTDWVQLTSVSSGTVPTAAAGNGETVLMAGWDSEGPALWSSGPLVAQLPTSTNGEWQVLWTRSASFDRIAAAENRVVIVDGGSVFEVVGGRLVGRSGLAAGVRADQIAVTSSAIFVIDGFDIHVWTENGWSLSRAPIGFLAEAIIETESGYIAARALEDHLLVSLSADGMSWREPVAVNTAMGFVVSTSHGSFFSSSRRSGGTESLTESRDGVTWSPIEPPAMNSEVAAWVIDSTRGSLELGGVYGHRTFVYPQSFLPVVALWSDSDELIVGGYAAGRFELAWLHVDGSSEVIPAGLGFGLPQPISTVFVSGTGDLVGLAEDGQLVVWVSQVD